MAAIFPPNTSQPWTFNGVTYQYDADDDRWYVISTNKVDYVDDTLSSLGDNITLLNETVDRELDTRDTLIQVGADKNNQQDAAIAELDARLDTISENIGILEFKGQFQYVLEKTQTNCDAAYIACLTEAGGDQAALRDCALANDACEAEIDQPLEEGTFTSVGTLEQGATEELVISKKDLNGNSFDWTNLVEADDYLELVEETEQDTVLYQVIAEPILRDEDKHIRVKMIRETGEGDGQFNLTENYEIRVFKKDLGIDLNDADARYVKKPYAVIFSDTAPTTGDAEDGVLRNGELWFDTVNLELFVWNNNSWVTSAKPPTQDIVIQSVIGDVDNLIAGQAEQGQRFNSLVSDLLLENNIYYSDDPPTGDITGTLRDGDIWFDSDELTANFYSGGAWINPDRQSGGDYLQKTEAASTYLSLSTANSDYLKKTAAASTYLKIEDYVPGGGVVGGLPTTGGIMTGTLSSKLAGDSSHYSFQILDTTLKPALGVWCPGGVGSQTKVVSRNGTALWLQNYNSSESEVSTTAKFNYASYNLKAQNNITYSASDAHYFKGNVLINSGAGVLKFQISPSNVDTYPLARFEAGFVVKAPGAGINGDNNFAAYPNYCWYKGRISEDNDLVNKKYVDDRIAELEARITALGG